MGAERWRDYMPTYPRIDVEPLYGPAPFTPRTRCCDVHSGPIRRGSPFYCEVCGSYGRDGFESVHQHPLFDLSRVAASLPRSRAPSFVPRGAGRRK